MIFDGIVNCENIRLQSSSSCSRNPGAPRDDRDNCGSWWLELSYAAICAVSKRTHSVTRAINDSLNLDKIAKGQVVSRLFLKVTITISLFISSGLSAPAKADSWTAVPRKGFPAVTVSKTATDGRTVFRGGCNKLLGPGLTGSFELYLGNALRKIDDRSQPASFEISGEAGMERFPGSMHYVAREKAWVITGLLPPAIISALGRGDTLTVRNGQGTAAFAFTLEGAATAAATMQKICGLAGAQSPQARKKEPSIADGPSGFQPGEFERKCIACLMQAHSVGRSVGGFCPVHCADVYGRMICDRNGSCRPGP